MTVKKAENSEWRAALEELCWKQKGINQGVPQGGPLSPLLSNIILDKLDKELEKRGHRYVRYADDCSIYVRSKRSGDRVMESITQYSLMNHRMPNGTYGGVRGQ